MSSVFIWHTGGKWGKRTTFLGDNPRNSTHLKN